MKEIIQKIYDYSLEDIMGDRFGRYSKTIIQDRAIPDVRDGLKPVQRRILYSMYKEKNTYDKAYRKSARSVGDIMGKYHPHGDSSIYDAMVRMSQNFKLRQPYIDMHGNNGSIDGDSPAAMRYTEARLDKISAILLKDIEKDTVNFAPNFDDTLLEPTVLPAKFPNLLVNGAMGISAGYATNIPPHNITEIIDATIKRIDSPNCRLDTIMEIVKGPDFPTGGIASGIDGIRSAFETGRGKIILSAKCEVVKVKSKKHILITDIPYDVNKANLISKIGDIIIDKKIEGMAEIRDESARDELVRIVIDLKKDANDELILKYLLKNTDMQVSYNYNMVAIVNRRPKQLGIMAILDAYIVHAKRVITKRSEFELEHAKRRLHIVEGLIKAISILDEIITLIRQSKNKSDAKNNLVLEFNFSEKQAEAIVMLQLYRLSNTDITDLEEEMNSLLELIKSLNEILSSPEVVDKIIKEELREIRKLYGVPRLTAIEDEIVEIKIDAEAMIPKEEVIVTVTSDGYVKRVTKRSYSSSNGEPTGMKENDYLIGEYLINTIDTLLLFTNLGNYIYVPVHTITDAKWKDIGKHVSNLVTINENEKIIKSLPVYDFNQDINIMSFTKNGMIKKTALKDYDVQRYSKTIKGMNLKKDDKVINVTFETFNDVFIATKKGYGLWYDTSEVPVTGVKAGGVKSINLKDDEVVSGINFDSNNDYISLITDKGTGKRIKLSDFDKTSRAKRGLLIIREVKTNPHEVKKVLIEDVKEHIIVDYGKLKEFKLTELGINDRYSTGSSLVKGEIENVYSPVSQLSAENFITTKKPVKKEIKEVKEIVKEKVEVVEDTTEILTIDDFLEDIDF